jgi:uncharacterized protein YndB with AHSA1/START domain
MRNVKLERTLAAPQSSVWAVLADYPNIADWNDGVKNSYAIGDATEGVGAQRQTELAPDGKMRMRETVTEWVPEERMVMAIDKMEKMPVKQARMTFTLSGGDETTLFTMSYDYEPKGALWSFLGPVLDRQFGKGFSGFIDLLEPVAQARAAA